MDSSSARGSTGQLSSSGSTGGGMHHSLSTPAGVDGGARTPPATPKKGSKMLAIRVQMLDDTETIFQVQAKALGRVLFEQVCKQLHLLEADYFGLEYADAGGTRYWLDLQKPISRQLGLSLVNPLLYFCVKFYTPDPGQLEEEYTRYLFCLQVKRDLSHGLMQCNENTAALMASYIVQAECGDYVAEDYPDHKHLSSYKFVPQQDQEMERKIMENHKKHAGQTPAEADLNLLETARRCELYGMKMHPAKDHENVPLNLAVAHMGILVFQNYTKINTFSWAKIRKISFKRKRFLIKLHPEGYGYYKDTVEFFFEGRNECKNFWKKCVENHGFFRCSSVKHVSRHKTRVLSRGSSFRYSGKTQKQIVEFVRDNYVKRQTFQRSASFRHSSAHSSASNMHASTVGNSISAHPLLPLADSNLSVEASKLSASLGSMGAVAGAPASPTTRSASRHHATATSWSSVPDTRATTTRQQPPPPPVRTTTTLPSPPPTMPSSAQTTTVAAQAALPPPYQPPCVTSSPLAVRAAVHRADITTGTTTTIIMNHTPPPPPAAATRTSSTPHTAIPRTPSSHSPPPPLLFTTTLPLQTQSQSDLGGNAALPAQAHRKRQLWTRSASCRDLYDFSFEDSGKAKRRAKASKEKQPPVAAESPITRYDDHRAIYAGSRDSSLETHQDIMMPDLKVYSSSYPGTTSYSQESVEDPGNYDLRDSQDDLSHDSYELIEKSDDDTSGDYKYHRRKPAKPLNTRSCSLDSGNYLPSDNSESEEERRHKSSYDIFNMEDPRDLPREITPRKSDGSFYKAFKATSRTSSLESYEKPRSRGHGSRASSTESRSEYYDAASHAEEHQFHEQQQQQHEEEEEEPPLQVLYHPHEFDRKISFERNYGVQMLKCDKEVKEIKETKHVHSMSLQNVEMERGSRVVPEQQNTIPRTAKATYRSEKSSSSEVQPFINAHVWSQKQSTESESNIFSFDEDKIQSLQQESAATTARRLKDFMEIEPRKCRESLPLHQPIERTKSDPNSLARQRINSSARRMLLMHQKSIDLTPAESSDEDYLYKQIPSAPPIMKYRGSHFEMPSAEFGHFDILARGVEGQKTKFEVPKSQFEILGAKTQSDFINLPPKSDDIPYVLHKRHVMNGTATKDEIVAGSNTAPQDAPPPKPVVENPASSSFLFTQNVDLSKIDPVTLEVDKSEAPIHLLASPKRDITHIDPVLLEALNSKLSQIESDSPTSSKTESLKPQILQKLLPAVVTAKPPQPPPPKIEVDKKEITHLPPKKAAPSKQDLKKRIIKPRMQPGKKSGRSNKTKVRITSFSSDDESLDSDDVFGTAEATPTRMEFSPPQMRKEMESILKYESERKYLQYTMSSTEVEGSPPQIRKKATQELDPNVATSELRRISERSISIPSSEDDLNIKTADLQPVFEPPEPPGFAPVLSTVQEYEKLQAEIEDDIKNLQVPPKTKITDLSSLRRKGQSPLLFAHARLNLSEGSAFTLLQRQQAAESPLPGRRAKSLDTPVISVSRLPPLNAFSSKDDTVEEELQALSTDQSEPEGNERQPLDFSSQPSFQFSPQPSLQLSPQPSLQLSPQPSMQFSPQPSLQLSPQPSLQLSPQPSQQLSPQSTPQPSPQPSIERDQIVPDLLKHIKKSKAALQAKSKRKAAAAAAKVAPRPPAPDPETEENIDKGQESDASARRAATKEKAKSLEKLELKRVSSKERSRSQDDSDTDRRKEKQQMLYETAIKQTKTIKSPVKDAFPVFPQVEEMVRERHGKLEISINTIENTKVSLEEAIIITKSPKKLDKKLTKSLELNLEGGESTGDEKTTVQRLGKSLDLETRPKLEVVEADIHKEPTNIVLEGTSLDVWLSMEKPASIAVPEESESGSAEAKPFSPSEASSKPIVMLGTGGIEVLQQGTDFFEEATPANGKPPDLGKIEAKSSSDSQSLERVSLGNSLDIKYIDDSGDSSHKSEQDSALVAELQKASDTVGKFLRRKLEKRKARATSEEESLTEVSDLKADGAVGGSNYLTPTPSKESLLRLSVERSRSEETGSWMTIECEECVGDSFETEPEPDENLLMTKQPKLLKRTSSDTTGSWTSGEKDQQSPSPNINKETDDSSVSCALGQAMGYSQNIEKFGGSESSPEEAPRSPRSPRSPRICVLGRAFTIDEESGGGSSGDEGLPPYKKTPYPFEDKWAPELSTQQLQKPGQHKLLSSTDKLSTESRNSLDTESSSGSLGAAARMQKSGDIPKELSSTWKPFPLDSSGSESFDDAILPQDNIVDNICDITPTRDDTELPEDLANFSITYPCITSNIASLGLGGGTFLSRTLSRISERSTNSEKSSLEEDSTKASTQSDSLNDSSSNPQVSLSSDPPSNAMKTPTNDLPPPPSSCYSLLQRQISDDRRTSAEMAELSIDDIEIITSERGLKLKRQGSDDTIIDEEYEGEAPMKGRTSSQESEEWPLPDIPQKRSLMAMHELQSSDTSQQTTQVFQAPVKVNNIPKVFGLRGSLKSQDSEQWPSPPSSVAYEPVTAKIETYYIASPEEADKVTVESSNVSTYDNDSISGDDKTSEIEKTHTYENVATERDSISESLSLGTGVKIVLASRDSNSDEDLNNSNDDVFTSDTVEVGTLSTLRPPTSLRRSTTSEDSSHSAERLSAAKHSSEEDCTSSMGFEDGTVRYALKPAKCTHSSHSEDTSIGLSLSEWSNSNTVKFQNMSSNSGTTKSDASLSEWSSSNSNTLKAAQSSSLAFQKLSSTSTGDSTLTDLLGTASSSEHTLVPQQFLSRSARLGSSIDDVEALTEKSPKNIPSEDFSMISVFKQPPEPKYLSTERPIVIPPAFHSDTEKSSSSEVQRTCASAPARTIPMKLAKCPHYYSSSLSSESTPLASTSPNRTATFPLTRPRKSNPPSWKSAASENDSTSSVESPKNDRRERRRRKQSQKRHHPRPPSYQEVRANVEEGYLPDGDSQSGSDIFRMEKDDEFEIGEGFDVTLIPPPLLEDDFEEEQEAQI